MSKFQGDEPDLLLIGGGGHALSILGALESVGRRVVGILERTPEKLGSTIMGVPILGSDEEAMAFDRNRTRLIYAVIGFGDPSRRQRALAAWRAERFGFESVQHASAFVSPGTDISEGVQILARALVNVGVRLGRDAIVNSAAVVEHGCHVGEGAHIAPGAVLGGEVVVEPWAQVGLNATILPRLRIGAGAIVGAGAMVRESVAPYSVVAGNPARRLA